MQPDIYFWERPKFPKLAVFPRNDQERLKIERTLSKITWKFYKSLGIGMTPLDAYIMPLFCSFSSASFASIYMVYS